MLGVSFASKEEVEREYARDKDRSKKSKKVGVRRGRR